MDGLGLTEVDLVGCHQANACVMMVLIIPGEETAAERAGIIDGVEPFGKLGLIFQRLEVSFREWVVIRGMRSAVGFDHAEIGQHQGRRLGLHGPATIGVQGQLVGRHGMLGHGVRKQGFEQGRTFRVLDTPSNDAAAEDVEDDVKIEIGPFHRSHQFGDVPGPDLIGRFCQQFGLLVNWMAALAASFGDLAMGGKDPVHRAD